VTENGSSFSRIAFDEGADAVSEMPVPLPPHQTGKAPTQKITADIPCFGNQPQVVLVPQQTDLGN
jgi:hypothetical protein